VASSSIHVPRLGGHIPALDGVRGLAVLMVFVYHVQIFGAGAGPKPVAPLGWMGVDLFFVLSGFLITGILLDAKGKASYFRNFFVRRSLRIFPLYYAVLLVSFLLLPLVFSRVLAPPPEIQAWFWTYLTNVYIVWQGWGTAGRYFDHFWSLAVEEQFYLFWPVVVFLCDRRRLLRVCLAGVAVAAAVRVAFHLVWWHQAAYVLLPARMDALVLGALVALMVREPGGLELLARWARPVAVATAALLAGVWYWRDGLDVYDRVIGTLGYSLFAVLFAAVIVLAITADPARRFGRLCASPGLRFFGRYSYAIYVFHHPILILLPAAGVTASLVPALAGTKLPGYLLFGAAGLVLTTGLALLSWTLCESPFLRLKERFTCVALAVPAGAAVEVEPLTAHPAVVPVRALAPRAMTSSNAPS
jgi:peptidoglycan/LPS O-acetylase OafA/YrhL